MSLPTGLTDDQMYVIYATHFANIDVRVQDLVRAAEVNDPSLIPAIIQDWQKANANSGRARLRLFLNQSAAINQLIEDFLDADKKMAKALKDLQGLPNTIGKISGLINKAVAAGSSLIDQSPKKPNT